MWQCHATACTDVHIAEGAAPCCGVTRLSVARNALA